jgi:hypothetical protein
MIFWPSSTRRGSPAEETRSAAGQAHSSITITVPDGNFANGDPIYDPNSDLITCQYSARLRADQRNPGFLFRPDERYLSSALPPVYPGRVRASVGPSVYFFYHGTAHTGDRRRTFDFRRICSMA